MKNIIFLCIDTCIFIFSVIALNFAINGLAGKGHYSIWGNPINQTDIWRNTEFSFGVADYSCS